MWFSPGHAASQHGPNIVSRKVGDSSEGGGNLSFKKKILTISLYTQICHRTDFAKLLRYFLASVTE